MSHLAADHAGQRRCLLTAQMPTASRVSWIPGLIQWDGAPPAAAADVMAVNGLGLQRMVMMTTVANGR